MFLLSFYDFFIAFIISHNFNYTMFFQLFFLIFFDKILAVSMFFQIFRNMRPQNYFL